MATTLSTNVVRDDAPVPALASIFDGDQKGSYPLVEQTVPPSVHGENDSMSMAKCPQYSQNDK